MSKVSYEDLDKAVQWLQAYEAAPDEDASGMLRVAEMLEKIIRRRDNDAAARSVARDLNVPIAVARRALRNIPSN